MKLKECAVKIVLLAAKSFISAERRGSSKQDIHVSKPLT